MDGGNKTQLTLGLNELRAQGRMTRIEARHRRVAAPDDVGDPLSKDGLHEGKRETTTSRRDLRPSGGVSQGLNPDTGCVDGESLRDHALNGPEHDPYTDDGGES